MTKTRSRITLKKVSLKDETEFLGAAKTSRKLHRSWVEVPMTTKAFRTYATDMRTADDMAYLIRSRDSGELVGVIELQDIFLGNFRNAYVIYYAFEGHERQGYMSEALRQVIRIAFSSLRLHRLEANIQPDNLASRKLAKSCGFRKEGYSPKFLKKGGRWRDHERWALLSTDPLP